MSAERIDLAELRRLHEAATPGPRGFHDPINDHVATCGVDADGSYIYADSDTDAVFNVAAYNILPHLLAVVEAAKAWQQHDTLENNAALRSTLAPFAEEEGGAT